MSYYIPPRLRDRLNELKMGDNKTAKCLALMIQKIIKDPDDYGEKVSDLADNGGDSADARMARAIKQFIAALPKEQRDWFLQNGKVEHSLIAEEDEFVELNDAALAVVIFTTAQSPGIAAKVDVSFLLAGWVSSSGKLF